MIPFNRKRALLIASGMQSFIIAFICVLFASAIIEMPLFLALLVTVSIVFIGIVIVIFRKLPPE